MSSHPSSADPVGVVGAGSFGTALANLLAENQPVLLYARRADVAKRLEESRQFRKWRLHDNIQVINDLETIANECQLIFPIVPSENFRQLIRDMSPFLRPYHMLLHGTKGLDVELSAEEDLKSLESINKNRVRTMSELIRAESVVLRVGCVAGPNLASEIAEGMPAATVVASPFEEVIKAGQQALRSSMFRVHANHDLLGVELAGVLKNIMAIASGILKGLGYGDNTAALLLTRGLAEMASIGRALGADPRSFLGLAGLGDLIATCNSPKSRNYTVGYRLAKGEALDEIITDME
ncbi:MAG: NAD(P)H-dependent glycerol-3-phosphate dehydrogenase, partial [Bacteroidota bacterium]